MLEEQIETIYNYDYFSQDELEEYWFNSKIRMLLSLCEVTTQIKEKLGMMTKSIFCYKCSNLILLEEYFDKQVFSKSIENYILVKQKEFAYNLAKINIGSIGK